MTGEKTFWEIINICGQNLFRIFNCREGFTPKDDTLPDRFFEGLENGALKGTVIEREEFDRAIEAYYGMMGWDTDTGIPTPAKLHELGLGWAVSEIHPDGSNS